VHFLARTSLLLFFPIVPAVAQSPAPRALDKPEVQFGQPFDAVYSVRELPGGKVLVTDLGPKSVLLADFAVGDQTTVGRNGQGPGEYQFPGDLIPYLGDTTLLVDRAGRRLLPITPDGKIAKTIPFPESIQGLGDPRGADRRGRIYFQGSPFPAGGNGAPPEAGKLPDTVVVLRWDRASGRVDTIARVKIPALKMQVSGTQNARAVMIRPQPFAPADEWAASPDGQIAVARVGDFHVEWLGGATPVRGTPVRYDRIKVGDSDKSAYMSNMRNSRNRITVNQGGPGRGAAEIKPPEPDASEFEWPDYKPPFPARAAQMAPEGTLWLTRSTSAQDSTPVFDLFDAKGNLTGRVTLPLGRRLVGLGTGTLYAVRTDSDGLQWLERYRR
jgi:hypothetical protein